MLVCTYVEVEVEVPVPYAFSPPSNLSRIPYMYASSSFLLSAVSKVQEP